MLVRCVNKLEKTLDSKRSIARYYSKPIARRILFVLSELAVASCLDDIPSCPPDRRHKMTGAPHTWSIDLSANYRMWVQSAGEEDPRLVKEVTIVQIFDDH